MYSVHINTADYCVYCFRLLYSISYEKFLLLLDLALFCILTTIIRYIFLDKWYCGNFMQCVLMMH